MTIKSKLDIVLITYNRKDFLEKTLLQIFAENSPIRDFDITVLDNNSTDGTAELMHEYCSKYPNLKHVRHKYNIGGTANIVKAYTEYSNKAYIWLLCDNDTYNWDSWHEVEYAINNNFDCILTKSCKNTDSEIFHQVNFAPACIYKTKIITDTVVANMYDNIRNLFPHLALIAKNINDKNRFYIVKKDIVNIGINPDLKTMYVRDMDYDEIPVSRKMLFWSVGFFNSVELIKERKKQIEIIDGLRHFHKSLFDLFKTIVIYNQYLRDNYFYNLKQIFRILSFKQKVKFIFAYILVKLSRKNYKYWFIRYKEEWEEYLKTINEQKYLDRLSKKLKNKKILLYGAGLTSMVLLANYNFSNFNIVGICDKKFENENSNEFFYNLKPISPSELKNIDFDVILFTLKEFKKIKHILKTQGINKKMFSAVKISNKYALRV
ncbi:glycosyltransferase family 2 protein [bacterium]|nr:glycosyltransferase family 2 protein [bacterium]